MNKRIFLFVLFAIALISPVLAQPPFLQNQPRVNGYTISVPQIGTLKQNVNFTMNFHVTNISNGYPIDNSSTNCFLHLYNASGVQILETPIPHSDSNVDNEWEIIVSGGNFSSLGDGAGKVECFSSTNNLGGIVSFGFDITPTGSSPSNLQLSSRIFLILFLIFAIFLIQWNSKRIDYDKWYNKIAEKYRTKNTFRWVLSALGYNLFKNSYVFSYLVGLLAFLVLTELTVFFNITSLIQVMKILLGIYTWGALAVVIVFFSQVQEWIMEWKEDLEKINWGELTRIK